MGGGALDVADARLDAVVHCTRGRDVAAHGSDTGEDSGRHQQAVGGAVGQQARAVLQRVRDELADPLGGGCIDDGAGAGPPRCARSTYGSGVGKDDERGSPPSSGSVG